MGRVGQLEQSQRSGEIEDRLQDQQQDDGEHAGQEAVRETPHWTGAERRRTGLGEDLDGEDGEGRQHMPSRRRSQQRRALGHPRDTRYSESAPTIIATRA